MLQKSLLNFLLFFITCSVVAQQNNSLNPSMKTRWAAEVSAGNVWQQYPRPQVERAQWKCLNGLWEYTILPKGSDIPTQFDGTILVPFPIESQLSGVQKKVLPDQDLWYHTVFSVPDSWKKQQIILHFGACDWHSTLYINGKKVGEHKGGYDAFQFDITDFLLTGKNKILLKTSDPSDKSWQPVGKQVLKPEGCFYTTVTGIWQTVWIEPVSKTHLQSVKYLTDIDKSTLTIIPQISFPEKNIRLIAEASFNGITVARAEVSADKNIELPLKNAKLWSPDHPNLYDLKLTLVNGNKQIDLVKSYFGMRKISIGQDNDSYVRILLNNHFVFQNGPLDQGYWPDGLYTPPTESAMINDLQMVKQLGFNMLRKHVKVECDRFYYWCDKMGILVWQDMPNGDTKIWGELPDIERSTESEQQFRFEYSRMIEQHYNFPSIVMWVPFNEGWGQFKSAEITAWTKQLDPTRLVNHASGWSDRGVSDVKDIHTYPEPSTPPAEKNRAIVIGEFGGLGYFVDGHLWNNSNWGYHNMQKENQLIETYASYYKNIYSDVKQKGLSAVIYTQLTDVETECNGLLTYDRAVLKIKPQIAYGINKNLFLDSPFIDPSEGWINRMDKITISAPAGLDIRYTLDGTEPSRNSLLYTQPIEFAENQVIKAKSFNKSSESLSSEVASLQSTDLLKPIYSHPFSHKYPAGGYYALCNGIKGGNSFSDGTWQGFQGHSPEIIFTQIEQKQVSEISMQILQDQRSWIFFPSKITVSISNDGLQWQDLPPEVIIVQPNDKTNDIRKIKFFCTKQYIKYLKVKFESIGNCPEWHPGKGNPAWIFVDEIESN